MVINLPNILPINVVGTISGSTASGTPTSIFSLAAIQNVVIVNEDPLEVNLVGGGADVDALTVSGGSDLTGTVDFVGSNGVNISDSGNTITIDGSGIIDAVGITAIVQDTNPTLGSDMDADDFDIAGVHELTAATGTFTNILTISGVPVSTVVGLRSLEEDTNPVLGNDLDGESFGIVGVGLLSAVTGTFTQSLTVSGVPVVTTDQVGILSVVEDTTPQLGGNLDAQSNDISSVNEFTAVTGTFTTGLTVGPGSTFIDGGSITTASGIFNSGDANSVIIGNDDTSTNRVLLIQGRMRCTRGIAIGRSTISIEEDLITTSGVLASGIVATSGCFFEKVLIGPPGQIVVLSGSSSGALVTATGIFDEVEVRDIITVGDFGQIANEDLGSGNYKLEWRGPELVLIGEQVTVSGEAVSMVFKDDVEVAETTLDAFGITAPLGDFADGLTVSGVPVSTTDQVGILSVVEDTTPELGGNLDALTRDITNVDALTAVTGTFTTGLTIGTGTVSITSSGINFSNLPTDPGPLSPGDLWVDTVADFTLKVIP